MMVSGKALVIIPKFVKKKFGKESFENWLAKITPEAREVYMHKIDEDKWYPLRTIMVEPTANIAQLFFKWDLDAAAHALGAYSAEYKFKGLMKVFVKIPSPNFFLGKGAEYLNDYYKPCSLEIPENSPGRTVIRITNFPEMEQTVESRIKGWIQRGVELNGAKEIKVDIPRSMLRFDPVSEFVVTWKT